MLPTLLAALSFNRQHLLRHAKSYSDCNRSVRTFRSALGCNQTPPGPLQHLIKLKYYILQTIKPSYQILTPLPLLPGKQSKAIRTYPTE